VLSIFFNRYFSGISKRPPKCFTQVRVDLGVLRRPSGIRRPPLSGRRWHSKIEPGHQMRPGLIYFSQRPQLDILQKIIISTICIGIYDSGTYRHTCAPRHAHRHMLGRILPILLPVHRLLSLRSIRRSFRTFQKQFHEFRQQQFSILWRRSRDGFKAKNFTADVRVTQTL
jgi:hypothetical protein